MQSGKEEPKDMARHRHDRSRARVIEVRQDGPREPCREQKRHQWLLEMKRTGPFCNYSRGIKVPLGSLI